MGKIKVRKNIEIERNPVERTILNARDFIKDNRKKTVNILIAAGVLALAVIVGLVSYSNHLDKHLAIYEKIMDNYEKNREKDQEIVKKTLEDLHTLSGSVKFGFVDDIVNYHIGNLYYSEKNYKEARRFLVKFAEVTSSDALASVALNKAAIALEESGDFEGALMILKRVEDDYSDSVIADQALYNMGRLHSIQKRKEDAVVYFNRVISLFPRSAYADKARKRLFLIGL
jgi:tetratricopeptide (TPR) repeat protein